MNARFGREGNPIISVRAIKGINKLLKKEERSFYDMSAEEFVDKYTQRDLLIIRGVGKTTIKELVELFASIGLVFKKK